MHLQASTSGATAALCRQPLPSHRRPACSHLQAGRAAQSAADSIIKTCRPCCCRHGPLTSQQRRRRGRPCCRLQPHRGLTPAQRLSAKPGLAQLCRHLAALRERRRCSILPLWTDSLSSWRRSRGRRQPRPTPTCSLGRCTLLTISPPPPPPPPPMLQVPVCAGRPLANVSLSSQPLNLGVLMQAEYMLQHSVCHDNSRFWRLCSTSHQERFLLTLALLCKRKLLTVWQAGSRGACQGAAAAVQVGACATPGNRSASAHIPRLCKRNVATRPVRRQLRRMPGRCSSCSSTRRRR